MNTGYLSIFEPHERLTIHEVRGLGRITFKPGQDLDVGFVKGDDEGNDNYATVTFDFGMEIHVPLTSANNFLISSEIHKTNEHCVSDSSPMIDKIRATLEFDLDHAFLHINQDPNYNTYHWALFGNLKDRVNVLDCEETEIKLKD